MPSSPLSPSGYSDQLNDDYTYKAGTEIHDDFTKYKESQQAAQAAATDYREEASARDRTKVRSESEEVPTPNSSASKDWNTVGRKSFYKDDHDVLMDRATDTADKYDKHAHDRDDFNEKYKKVMRNQGKKTGVPVLDNHLEEAEHMWKAGDKYEQKAQVHEKYGNIK